MQTLEEESCSSSNAATLNRNDNLKQVNKYQENQPHSEEYAMPLLRDKTNKARDSQDGSKGDDQTPKKRRAVSLYWDSDQNSNFTKANNRLSFHSVDERNPHQLLQSNLGELESSVGYSNKTGSTANKIYGSRGNFLLLYNYYQGCIDALVIMLIQKHPYYYSSGGLVPC